MHEIASQIIESCVDEAGGFEFSGADFQRMCRPCVYMFMNGDELLYVGMSSYGMARTASNHHRQAKKAQAEATKVFLYPCKSVKAAQSLERVFLRLQSKYNQTGSKAILREQGY